MRGRGLAGLVESAWSGRPGTIPWTAALWPAASLYGAAASAARRRAAASRRAARGVTVIAVGNLTVGGTGKSSLARWLAARAAETRRAAVLLRGHGGRHGGARPAVLPDFAGYPLARLAERFGDEAASHRAALPERVAVVAGRNRREAAIVARDGYGAGLAVMDDGWEQGSLAWDELWVTLDAARPVGNGRLLPAGPLRRPPETLREADVVAFILEGGGVPERTLDWARRAAPRARLLRFRRILLGVTRAGEWAGVDAGERGATRAPGDASRASGETVGRAALITAVGDPNRVAAFAEQAGIRVVDYVSFPDHARVGPERLRRAMTLAARRGAEVALITEKDEHRWALPYDPPIPVRVLRTGLEPLDPVALPGEAARPGAEAAPSRA
jgi:tetraacyldisaccharide 4'-kinase